jgi:metal-responsive CopG/Arc/MetJ family transcriptional regulator
VKTAISLPDATFERVNKRAARLHLSRSEFFARAAEQYLDHLDSSSITDEIDDVVEQTKDDSGRAAVATGLRRLAESDDEW